MTLSRFASMLGTVSVIACVALAASGRVAAAHPSTAPVSAWTAVLPPSDPPPEDEPMSPSGLSVFGWIAIAIAVAAVTGGGIAVLARRASGRAAIRTLPSQTAPDALGLPPTTQPPAGSELAAPFREVERQVRRLRQQVAEGLLTEAECKQQMRELMIQDADDNWWMVGYESGEWYRHDGTGWALAKPPAATLS